MKSAELQELLRDVKNEAVTVEDALERLARLPLRDLGHSVIDTHREVALWVSGSNLCGRQEPARAGADRTRTRRGPRPNASATRVRPDGCGGTAPSAAGCDRSRTLPSGHCRSALQARAPPSAACSSSRPGPSDGPVAEEAAVTARNVRRSSRNPGGRRGGGAFTALLASESRLRQARVLVVVAGLEGALPSVIRRTRGPTGNCGPDLR